MEGNTQVQNPQVQQSKEVNECNDCDKDKSHKISPLLIITLIISLIALVGLFFLYIFYFFRNVTSTNGYTIWTFYSVTPDSGTTTGTITPVPNGVYILDTTITNVKLVSPTVKNYTGTQFVIKAPKKVVASSTIITPPSGVSIEVVSLGPNGIVTLVWKNTTTLVTV